MKLSSRPTIKTILLIAFLLIYLAAGIRTFLRLLDYIPGGSQSLMQDFNFYRRAAIDAKQGRDPYQERRIGPAFLYPPPALLIVEAVELIPESPSGLQPAVYILLNMLLLGLIVYGVARYYHLRRVETWWWYGFAFGFAPFLEMLWIGQINMITAFGIYLLFYYEARKPLLAGFGLSLAAISKVTPLAFLGYLLVRKGWRTGAAALAWIAAWSGLALLRYGSQPFVTYGDVLQQLLVHFDLGFNSQALVTKIIVLFPQWAPYPEEIQSRLMAYFMLILAIGGLLAWRSEAREPFFLLVALAAAFSPNVMWYHHYIFLLLPTLVLLGSSRNQPWVSLGVVVVLFVVQVDRSALTNGVLIHLAAQLEILAILAWQVRLELQKALLTGHSSR